MKGQDKEQLKMFYDVYLVRGSEWFFSRRYLTEHGAKRRCVQLDDVWNKAGYKTFIKSVEIKPVDKATRTV